jgi:GNAT superfamily N-acetyltransferase
MGEVTIRTLQPADRAEWEPLWQGYQTFYKVSLPPEVTESTWQRFHDPAEPIFALGATLDGRLVGIVHYLFHRSSWMVGPTCYLQDLFSAPEARGRGVGRMLIEAVYAAARAEGAGRVYWMTHETNAEAMVLYNKVAERSGFIQYRKNL